LKSIISIIIPTYNRAEYLGATLDSILKQKYYYWECLVIDDGSIDYTKELMSFYCEEDDRFHFYQRPKNRTKGANACRNYGFELSKGKFINWFDSDDIMHPEFLNTKIEKLLKNNVDCTICTNKTFIIEKGAMFFQQESKLKNHNIFENICLLNYAVPTHAPLWRRSFFNDKVLFNENLSISQDLEFHSRVLIRAKVFIIQQSLFYLRKGHDNITSQLYSNLSKHFDSYFWVRKRLLSNFYQNKQILNYYRNELMGIFRYLLTLKKYKKAKIILNYLYNTSKKTNFLLKIDFLRIYFIFAFIKISGKGETKLKRYLYLSNIKN